MKRWTMIGLLVVSLVLAACGGDDDGGDNGGDTAPSAPGNPTAAGTLAPTATTRPPAPRSKAEPEGEPYDFEAPFSVGSFTRESMQGRAVSAQTGGLQATYQSGDDTIVLTAYHLDDADQAVATVRFALEAGSIIDLLEPPYYGPAASFGVALDRHGGYLAAWSHNEWCFLATSNGSLDALNNFLEGFPF